MPEAEAQGRRRLVIAPYRGHWEVAEFPEQRVTRASCGHLGWISPPGDMLIAQCSDAEIICMDCFDAAGGLANLPADAKMETAPGLMDFAARTLGEDPAETIRRFMNRWNIEER
jgi:hypothetical protein